MFHKVIITLLKPLSFLPALLVMYMIFSFSAQNGTESGDLSFKVSVKLVEVGSEVLDMKLTDSEIQMYANKYHHYVRKLGHMTEYCVLAITLCVPLYAYGVRGIWLYLLHKFAKGQPGDQLLPTSGVDVDVVGKMLCKNNVPAA